MVFAVIEFAADITGAELELASAGAPPCTASPAPYPELLEGAAWRVEERIDLTSGFDDISRRELVAFETRSDRLLALLGTSEFATRLALRRAKVAGIGDGSIRRALYVARPAVQE